MTSSDVAPRPQPVPDELTAPFWSAAANHKLVIQRCGRCTKFHAPASSECRHCGERYLVFEEVSGRGSVYSSCRIVDRAVPGFSLPTSC